MFLIASESSSIMFKHSELWAQVNRIGLYNILLDAIYADLLMNISKEIGQH